MPITRVAGNRGLYTRIASLIPSKHTLHSLPEASCSRVRVGTACPSCPCEPPSRKCAPDSSPGTRVALQRVVSSANKLTAKCPHDLRNPL
eukprot:1189787-Prorocentrum_minimum.AAC.2